MSSKGRPTPIDTSDSGSIDRYHEDNNPSETSARPPDNSYERTPLAGCSSRNQSPSSHQLAERIATLSGGSASRDVVDPQEWEGNLPGALNLQLPLVNSPGGASADRGGTANSGGNFSAGVAASGSNDNDNDASDNMEGEIVGGRRPTSSMREEYRLSGLSVSECDSLVSMIDEEENEDDEENDDEENHHRGKTSSSPTPGSPADAFSPPESPATPKSTLNLVHGNSHSGVLGMEMNGVSRGVTRERSSVSVMTSDSMEFAAAANMNGNINHNNIINNELRAATSPSPKAVDWLPKEKQTGRITGEEYSATTSQAVRMTEDISENSSFATTTTSGGRSSANEPSNTVIAAGGNIIDKQRLLQQIINPSVDFSAAGTNATTTNPTTTTAAANPTTTTTMPGNIPSVIRRQRNKLRTARSPRPPRHMHMRAVDWCPPSSSSASSSLASSAAAVAASSSGFAAAASAGGGGATRGSSSGGGGSSGMMASDKTTVTSRAVRLGDDATVTTFATMTTMGDAGSILEADSEDEESSESGVEEEDGDEGEGGREDSEDGGEEEDEDGDVVGEVGDGLGSFPAVSNTDDGALVDKIPSFSSGNMAGAISVASGTTNHAVRGGGDCDRSITSYATMNTFGDLGSIYESEYFKDRQGRLGDEDEEEEENEDDDEEEGDETDNSSGNGPGRGTSNQKDIMVDKVPSSTSTPGTSVVSGATNHAVRMGDDRSIVSFATMTTMGDMINTYDNVMGQPPALQSQTPSRSGMESVVDRTPSNTAEAGESVVSGTTNHSVRMGDEASIVTFATMTTAGRERTSNPSGRGGVVDKVPNIAPMSAASVATATTQHAIKDSDDQSVATWATMATSGIMNHTNEHVVDKTPATNEKSDEQSLSGITNRAVKQQDDQSVVTWNTMTTAGGAKLAPYAVDRVPSYSNKTSMSTSGNDTTNAVRGDDQSVVTFATMTTFGGDRGNSGHMVDKVPSFLDGEETSNAGKTTDTVVMGDNQSIATWTTMNTMGGQMIGNVVDKVPSSSKETGTSVMSLPTTNAVADDRSMATFTTVLTTRERGIQEVVDNVPTFAGGAGTSVFSGVTGQAVRMSDDRSVASLATMTTVGDMGSTYERDTLDGSRRHRHNRGRFGSDLSDSDRGNVVDKIPSISGGNGTSILSGRTDNAVRLGDDLTVTTFATMTTAGEITNMNASEDGDEDASSVGKPADDDSDSTPPRKIVAKTVDTVPSSSATVASGTTADAVRAGDDLTVTTFATMTTVGDGARVGLGEDDEEDEEVDVATGSVSSSSRFLPSGILRESRHNRVSALRENRGFRSPTSAAYSSSAAQAIPPINAGESVSNAHILRAITDLRFHVDYRIGELREMNKRDSEKVTQMIQQEQAKRTALEARLHSQLLLQSESMVAMELKLLRLEAKVAQRESHRQRRQPGIGGMAITDRLPPIAATPTSPNRIDEEVDSFEELELTPRAARHGANPGPVPHGTTNRGGPANIAVVTRSGASVASAVTATSFPEVDFGSHLHGLNDDGRSAGSEDGDVEDEGEQHNDGDGSHSTPPQESNNRISNLESILLNPISSGDNNDQGISTRATRGDTDGMSSLPTSVTSTTMASTVITSTTRGESIGVLRSSSRASEDDMLRENCEEATEASGSNAGDERPSPTSRASNIRRNSDGVLEISADGGAQQDRPRSRSQSPLTVQSAATASVGPQSVASASLGASILSSAAVASSRAFGTRRANAAIAAAMANNAEGRPLANRVVSFTTHDLVEEQLVPPQENDGGGDSITMPDELDNFSDIADAFSNSARVWREEYEARLDAIHKRLGN